MSEKKIIVCENDINADMFLDICDASCGVIAKMLQTDVVNVVRNEKGRGRNRNSYILSWESDTEKSKDKLYEQFIRALCGFSLKRKQKHSKFYQPKWLQTNNEKAYAYDLFKYISFFGKEYEPARKELLKPLVGTTAGAARNKCVYEVIEE